MTAVFRIFCVDPHPVVCAGLAALGLDEPELEFIGFAAGSEQAVEQVADRRPDVILLDPELLGADGFTLCRRLKHAAPDARVVLYTASAAADGLALQARVAGADGLVDKATSPAELFETLRVVGRGGTALPRLNPVEMEAAAHRVEPDDLALLAMLADRTPPADVADTLRMDGRGLTRRINRMLPRLRDMRPYPA